MAGLLDDDMIAAPKPANPGYDFRRGLVGAFLQNRTERSQASAAQEQAGAARRQAVAHAKQLGMSPAAIVLAAQDPTGFYESIKEAMKPRTMSRGQSSQSIMGSDFMPDVAQIGDQSGAYTREGQFTPNYTRPKTYAETETNRAAVADEQLAGQKFNEDRRQFGVTSGISQGHLNVARGNLGLERERMNSGEGAGELSTMTTEQLMDLAKGLN